MMKWWRLEDVYAATAGEADTIRHEARQPAVHDVRARSNHEIEDGSWLKWIVNSQNAIPSQLLHDIPFPKVFPRRPTLGDEK